MKKTSMYTFLFALCFMVGNAQPKDYTHLLDTFFGHAENSFRDIAEIPNDSSSFGPSRLKAPIGEVTIGRFPYAVTLNWIIPLAQAEQIQTDIKEYIRKKFQGRPNYQVVTDGTEEEGYKITSVYALKGNEKPLAFFKIIYYKDENDAEKSNFTIIIYGK